MEELTEVADVVDVVDEDEQIQQEVRKCTHFTCYGLFKPVPSWSDSMPRQLVGQSGNDGRPTKSRGRRFRECSYK